MIGLKEYKGHTKQTWRGWWWNRIADRIAVNEAGQRVVSRSARREILKDKIVLYLVGPNDTEREIALSKGFSNENLVAVDLSEANVSSARKGGAVAICDSMESILLNWPRSTPIAAISMDLCCGFTTDVIRLPGVIGTSFGVRRGTVIAVNLLRGRDTRIHEFRQCEIMEKFAKSHDGIPLNWRVHRGYAFATACCNYQESVFQYWESRWDSAVRCRAREMFGIDEPERHWKQWCGSNPQFYSYPSAQQRFDSVVFSHCGITINDLLPADTEITGNAAIYAKHLSRRAMGSGRTKQKLAAWKAVRTMNGH